MKNKLEVHFSSAKSDWQTPDEFFQGMEKLFGKFDLDVCAISYNSKCKVYISPDYEDSLQCRWTKITGFGQLCWMNPPYGRGITGKWVTKAIEESKKGCTVVCLLPARTDTKWFKDCYNNASEIYFVKGRLKFVGAKDSAPFPSMIVVFGTPEHSWEHGPRFDLMDTKGKILG